MTEEQLTIMRVAMESQALAEEEAVQAIRSHTTEMVPWAERIWLWGAGNGEGVMEIIWQIFADAGLVRPEPPPLSQERKQPIPPELRRQVLIRDDYLCRYCGSHRDITVDHVIPEHRDGPTTADNLVACCRSCNSKKGTKMPEEFVRTGAAEKQ